MKINRKLKEQAVKPLTFKDMPEDLIWRVKTKAAERHLTLKAFVIQALEDALKENKK